MVGSVVSAPPHCFEIQSGCPKLLLRLGRGLASRRRPEAPARDRRNDGGIDGRRRLTGQSPTATAEPIDKGSQLERAARSGSPAIAALRESESGVTGASHGAHRGRSSERWGPECGEAAAAEPLARASQGRAGVPCVGNGGGFRVSRVDRGGPGLGAQEQGRARDRGRPRQKLSTTHWHSVQPSR